MRKFILKGVLFITSLYSVLFLVDVFISKNIQPAWDLYGWQELYSGKTNADLLIFGSSRGQQSFNVKMIEDSLKIKTYNYGLINARIQISYLRLLEHLRLCKQKPKYVTLEIDFFTFENINNISSHWQIFPYMLYNNNMRKLTSHMEGYKPSYYFCPMIRYLGNLINLVSNSKKGIPQYYYKGSYLLRSHFDTRWKAGNDTSRMSIEIDSNKITLLYDFINTCKENDIKLNLVYAPEFYYVTHKIINRDSITNYIKSIAEKNGIPFKDISHPSFCADTAYFHNMRHVNFRGADKFTSEYYMPWIKELYGL